MTYRPLHRYLVVLSMMFVLALQLGAVQIIDRSPPPSVGTEGSVDVVLPYDDIEPAPFDRKADLVVRIAETSPWATGTRYDLRYVAAVPGEVNLLDALRRADGSALELDPILVSSTSVLPETHDGSLSAVDAPVAGGWLWYGLVAILLIIGWVITLVLLSVLRREKKQAIAHPTEHKVTFADQLRPLVEAASRNELDTEGRGRLERMLLGAWRRRLDLPPGKPAAMLRTLREHDEAGPLVVALERWLHRPDTEASVDRDEIARLLEPYRNFEVQQSESATAEAA